MNEENVKEGAAPKPRHKVRRMPHSKRWGVYATDGTLVEGGFFYETAALEVAWEYDNPLPPGKDRDIPF